MKNLIIACFGFLAVLLSLDGNAQVIEIHNATLCPIMVTIETGCPTVTNQMPVIIPASMTYSIPLPSMDIQNIKVGNTNPNTSLLLSLCGMVIPSATAGTTGMTCSSQNVFTNLDKVTPLMYDLNVYY